MASRRGAAPGSEMVPEVPAASAGNLHHGGRSVTGLEAQDRGVPGLAAQSAGVPVLGEDLHGGRGTRRHWVPAILDEYGQVPGGHGALLRRCGRGGSDGRVRGAAATPAGRGGSAIPSAPCTREGRVLEHPVGCPGESEFGGLTRTAWRESSLADGAPRPPSAGLPSVPRCVRDAGTSSNSRRGGDVERGAGTGIHREGYGLGVPRTSGLAGGSASASGSVIREGRVQDGGRGRQDMAETLAPACTDRLFHTMASVG